jgi:hypothetical protein
VSVAEDVAAAAAIAWELDKAAVATGKKAYGKAQELGMKFQNWRHQGAGETPDTPAMTGSTKPAGKSWSTDEEYENTTFYSHTSYKGRGK